MSYIMAEDTTEVEPLILHTKTCKRYTESVPEAPINWHECKDMQYAKELAEHLDDKNGCRACNDCLNGLRITDPK